jgi:hypothetical protein
MDAFLERFERFALAQKWHKDIWAVGLSPFLTGKGLDVYTSMPAMQASDYDDLKKAVLKPDRGGTVFQFVARLMRYFSRWIELSEIGGGLEKLNDLLIREQIIQVCSTELYLFLRERKPKNIEEVVTWRNGTLKHMKEVLPRQ